MTLTSLKPPTEFIAYVDSKSSNGKQGKPHFLTQLCKRNPDVLNEVLTLLEMKWIKNDKDGTIARKYKTSKITIWRLFQDLEPFKEEIIELLNTTPRRKKFFNEENESSGYESIATYIRRAKRDKLRNWRRTIKNAKRCWTYLKYKDPQNWTAEEVEDFFSTLTNGSQSNMLDCVRQVAPQIADNKSHDYIKTGRFREKIRRRKKNIFGKDVKLIIDTLKKQNMGFELLVFLLHITTGAREGSTGDPRAGLCGLTWERFKRNFRRVDLYESKVRGGFWCRDCPVDLIYPHLHEDLRELWKDREKPTPNEKLILGGYKELNAIYKRIRETLRDQLQGKVEPSLLQEFATLRPHDSDKIHCNLLWEARIPVEVVAGKYLGQGEGVGLMGRIWLDVNTITKYYLSLSERSDRMKEYRKQVTEYSQRFNGGKSRGWVV